MKIGVIAMQGAFAEHIKMFESLGVKAIDVRKPEDLKGVQGIVLPGGESTTVGMMMKKYGLIKPVIDIVKKGAPIFGTCAGLVLLSKKIEGGIENQPILSLLDVTTLRNAYGRQVDSFETPLKVEILGDTPFLGVFIRAPFVKEVGKNVKVLAKFEGNIVAVQQGNILATAFHPELTKDARFHQYFLSLIEKGGE